MGKKTRKPRQGLTEAEESFCRAVVENGGNATEALASAMPHTRKWKAQSRSERASKLLATAKVRTRVAELRQIMREKANAQFAMSAEEIVWRLTMLARANLRDYIEVDVDGQPTVVIPNADESKVYPLAELVVDDIVAGPRQGKRTRLKLPDRIAALKLLGSHHGMFTQEVKLSGGTPIPVVLSKVESEL